MKVFKVALTLAVIVGLGAGGMRLVKGMLAKEAAPSIPTLVVRKSTVDRIVPAEGTLKAEKATPITTPRGSRRMKIAWIKDNGSAVKEGEVVVRFDREEFERKLADGKDDQESAGYKLAIERTKTKGARQERERKADLARIDLKVAQERRTDENDEIFSRNELLTSTIDRQLSEARVDHAGVASQMDRSISRSKVKLLELEKKAAELAIGRAEDGLTRMEIKAPHDGIFVYESSRAEVGAMVWQGQTIAKLPLTASMEAEVFVLEADVKGLEEGMEANFLIEAQPHVSYAATIKKIDSLAKPRHQEVPIQYFSIILELEKTDAKIMKPGQRVRAELGLKPLEGLVVPRQCVFEVDGDMVVFRQGKGTFETVKVKLGAGTPGLVVIDEGLSEGDRIATQDPFGRSAGDEDAEDEEPQAESSK